MSEAAQTPAVPAAPTFQLLSPLSIAESKTNPRKHFDDAYIAELAESIKKNGLVQPLVVRPIGGGDHELVAGACRYRACKLAQIKALPCIVREYSDTEVLEVQLVENLRRRDLHPLEEGEGYRVLMKRHGYKVETIADRVGRSPKYIYDRVKLLALIKEAQELFYEDTVTAGHAVILARLDPKIQAKLVGPESNRGPLFTDQRVLHAPRDYSRRDEFKPISVRELQAWVDDNVRFDHATKPDPMLFPETAATMETAEKIVPITYEYQLPPEKKAKVKTLTINGWKRADGKKSCEYAITGVIAIGYGRGEAFKICTAKEKCRTHWGKEIAERARAAKQREKGGKAKSRATEADRYQRDREKQQRESAEFEARRVRFKKAGKEILKHLAATIAAASAASTGRLGDLIVKEFQQGWRHRNGELLPLIPRGETAEDLVRYIAWLVLSEHASDDWALARGEFTGFAKALGIDVAAILDEHAPVVGQSQVAQDIENNVKREAAQAKVHKNKRKRKAS